jgi:hypothetical protein
MYAKWEYKVVKIEQIDFEKMLEELGLQGWELVDANRPTYSAKYQLVFKRPILEKGSFHDDQVDKK